MNKFEAHNLKKSRRFEEVITALEERGSLFGRKLTLDPVTEGLTRLGLSPDALAEKINPQHQILVAGTNGKGSVSSTLAFAMQPFFKRVGFFCSPHLVDYRERIQVNGEMCSSEEFVELFEVVQSKTADLKLSYFEIITLMASLKFYSGRYGEPCDAIVWEAGLGGLYDTTNALPHSLCLITQLGIDHQKFLGNSLIEIAKNKFGIIPCDDVSWFQKFRPYIKVLCSPLADELKELKSEIEGEGGFLVEEISVGDFKISYEGSGWEPQWQMQTDRGVVRSPLKGRRGVQNLSLVIAALKAQNLWSEVDLNRLSSHVWPGRMQRVLNPFGDVPLFFSGDHNLQGIDSLLELIQNYRVNQINCIFGMSEEKPWLESYKKLASDPRCKIMVTLIPGQSKEKLLAKVPAAEPLLKSSLASEVLRELAQEKGENSIVLVTGSLYLVGEMMEFLTKHISR